MRFPTPAEDGLHTLTSEDLRCAKNQSHKYYMDSFNLLIFPRLGSKEFFYMNFTTATLPLKGTQTQIVFKYYDSSLKTFTDTIQVKNLKYPEDDDSNCHLSWDKGKSTLRYINGGSVEGSSEDQSRTKFRVEIDGKGWFELIAPKALPGFKVGDGCSYYDDEQKKFVQHLYYLPYGSESHGEITIPSYGKLNLEPGYGYMSRSKVNMAPHKIARQFHHLKFIPTQVDPVDNEVLDGPPSKTEVDLSNLISSIQFLYLMGTDVPKKSGGTRHCHGAVIGDERLATMSANAGVTWKEMAEKADKETKYTVPTETRYEWQGPVLDANMQPVENLVMEVSVDCSPSEKTMLCKFDVLAHVPWLLRIIIQKLIARPWLYQYWDDECKATVTVRTQSAEGDANNVVAKWRLRGWCMHESHFIND